MLVLVVALAAAIVVLALLKATPDVYRRTAGMGLDASDVARFNEHVVNQVGNVLLDKSGGTVLDIEITEAMINARLARYMADEAGAGRPVTPVLAALRVGFEPGRVVLATRTGEGLGRMVISQAFSLEAAPDGCLKVSAAGTRAGLVPLPDAVLDYLRTAVAEGLQRRDSAAAEDKTLDVWRAVLDALGGKPVPLGKGKKRINVESVGVERGTLRLKGRRAG